jgi:hypothetical protein
MIKEKLKNLPKLQLLRDSDELILETDASDYGWSGVVKNMDYDFDKNNIGESLCRYCFGTFTNTETRYHINEKKS